MCLIERVQKFDCATPDLSETAIHFTRKKLLWEQKGPVALARERAPVYVHFKPKDIDEVAHQQLPSIFAISFEARMA